MSIFKFKQFEVDQTGCAMKINTDGVLIGAIASHHQPKRGLDIGTGTGVISMILAQRYPQLSVHAVEIDAQAAETAGKNFEHSDFNSRLSISHMAIEHFETADKFDLIVSNPPFFVNDLKNEEVRKGIARHADDEFFEMLIGKANELLATQGRFWLILPVKQANEVIALALIRQLKLVERINLHSDAQKPTFRQIICLTKEESEFRETDFNIYESLKVHSQAYKLLLKDFFLAF
ncbi:methyltransferase [Pedobacter petrophilus]|uniref:tRNA1(Val) (adenine(37)-N6)-methyltransferase n=1 Tax=Pedobacter petrophilus TaxID=1908241 RepID=A0A7K0G5K7_9SPHI|nr:methyltransferase [Pedobacter petrophilus]MRX78286.1 methyltransferase [Pedobacter petrophilus]